jgi:NAD(P)-dependent dehydrogenase (short-subunit alcohol dehydrogenase family)
MLPQVWHRNLARVTRFKAYSITRSTSYSSLHGKIVAISGAASGMGLATAKLLYPMRVKLSLADINKDALHEAALSLEASASTTTGDVISVAADLRSSSEASAWIQTTVEKYGGLDGAANFAGILGNMTPVAETSDEEWSRVLKVNLNGTFFALRAQLKAMLDGGGKGSIVNTASIAGLRSGYAAAAYTVSKHGVIGLTKSAAKEVGHRGIRVNVIAP